MTDIRTEPKQTDMISPDDPALRRFTIFILAFAFTLAGLLTYGVYAALIYQTSLTRKEWKQPK